MTAPLAAVFCMPERSHFRRLLPLIIGLTRHGVAVAVFTDASYREPVERAGARFVDLFARYPLEAADATSRPVPCRYVSFAGHYAAALIGDVARLRPSLVLYDTFAIIGLVLGRHLGIPYVNVCAGHAMTPANAVVSLEHEHRLALSDAGRRAIEQLRERWGIEDASPHSYLTGRSPFLNVYCEPPIFLAPEERAALEPIAFFGSLPAAETADATNDADALLLGDPAETPVRLYASCGSVVWRYYEAEALQALEAVSDAVGALARARALISLGGHPLRPDARARLERPNVRVAAYVDQWRILQHASAFVTHHGLNSTHEAIYHRVPMLSYPFFADQPPLAVLCQRFGLAIPLAGRPREPLSSTGVLRALSRVADEAPALQRALERARGWELEVLAGREKVIEQLVGLVRHRE